MKKKVTIFVVLCSTTIAVWYSLKPESAATQSSKDSGLAQIDPSLNDPLFHVAEQDSHRLRKLQALTQMRDVARKRNPLDETEPSAGAVDDRPENELMAAEDNIPQQRVWRRTWIDEGEDVEWTKRMEDEVYAKVDSLLKGDVVIRHLSCRETVCRMYLQFESQRDADNFTSAAHDPAYQFEYQLLNPSRPGAEHPHGSTYNYEVLVARKRPANLPDDIRPLILESTKKTASVSSKE